MKMIQHYKICKYNYDENYENEWSSIWDFSPPSGDSFSLPSEYLDFEKKYLNVAIEFLKIFHDGDLVVSDIEDNRTIETVDDFLPIETHLLGSLDKALAKLQGNSVSFIDAVYLLQLSLREVIWVKLLHSSGAYISFGHDYYWLIGISNKYNIESLTQSHGLFVYDSEDPWE